MAQYPAFSFHAKAFSGICLMEWKFQHIGAAGLRILTEYLLSKLELVEVARDQNDWSYNHRLHRMLDGVTLLMQIHEFDVSEVIVRLFEVCGNVWFCWHWRYSDSV